MDGEACDHQGGASSEGNKTVLGCFLSSLLTYAGVDSVQHIEKVKEVGHPFDSKCLKLRASCSHLDFNA